MTDRSGVRLAELTTLRTGGPAAHATAAETDDELVDAVRAADTTGRPMLLIGGGSNLVAPDAGWPGDVILIRSRGIEDVRGVGQDVHVRVEAGEPWDEVVARSVAAGWSGLESLSGIPGRTGATPVQNVGAYGREVADSISGVEVFDRDTGHRTNLAAAACRFEYRDSRFKHTERFVVLAVRFHLRRSLHSAPIRYVELAARLGVEVGDRARTEDVRAAVLELRRSKGMVLDPADHDTWSAGSFFTNPVLPPAAYLAFSERARAHLGPTADWPAYPDPKGRKLSGGWLIEQAGFSRGYVRGPAALSGKHALALTNLGSATTADILALAAEITERVESIFGVRLQPEP
ncbi:MAG: UDP-N-acetylmuramate dehydrogenase, partial [Actinomycetota bacterium]|nr:UDP-N-acetylmuramate dehydrogenase [Actinomycetota bacterium]